MKSAARKLLPFIKRLVGGGLPLTHPPTPSSLPVNEMNRVELANNRPTTKEVVNELLSTRGYHEDSSIGLRDSISSGWYTKTGEVFQGIPISSEDVVLDVGCGDGSVAHWCAGRGASIIVSDIDPAKVAIATQRLADTPARSVRAIVGDANPLPLEDDTATVVISMEVLEHVDDPAQLLRELFRVGRPGARYLLTVPDPVAEQLQTRLAPAVYFAKPNHIRIIQREEFANLVSEAGLLIERRDSDGFYAALRFAMMWVCQHEGRDLPALDNWARTWGALLDTPRGMEVKRVLDDFMPKNQIIVARKPDE